MAVRIVLLILCLGLTPGAGLAEGKHVRLYAPPDLVETGLLKYILPRFSLKTQVRVTLSDSAADADMVLGDSGRALFEGAGRQWHMEVVSPEDPDALRFADWLMSDVGRNTILGFAPDGEALFGPPSAQKAETAAVEPDGDAGLGHEVARAKCTRCHAVDDESRMAGIGSTPSFAVLRSLPDWEYRFSAFYVLNPHPSFMVLEGIDPLFSDERPPPIVPVEMTIEEVEAVVAYVAAMPAANLGAPLQHQ